MTIFIAGERRRDCAGFPAATGGSDGHTGPVVVKIFANFPTFSRTKERIIKIVLALIWQPLGHVQGEHVTLPCQVENKRGMLQWTRDGFGLGIERNLTGFDRYHMVGSDEEGKNTSLLQIAYRYS